MSLYTPYIIAAAAVLIVFYSLYSGLIKKKNQVLESFSGIDVQLKKRSDVITNVLKLAGKFMKHEKSLLADITKLRTETQKAVSGKVTQEKISKKIALEKQVGAKMDSLFLAVENYPNIKSDAPIVQAQQTYNEIEEHIAASRRFYNAAVKELNNSVEIFPGNVVASMIGVKKADFYRATAADKKEVDVDTIIDSII
jgi:LemA protein